MITKLSLAAYMRVIHNGKNAYQKKGKGLQPAPHDYREPRLGSS